jgi:predicted glycoside hydrolase/deacetylase ChbG (UPF0249 family)
VDLILNADDFGASEQTVHETVACFDRGALTSATIMPGMPAAQLAFEFARTHPEFSFGVHLTFVTDGVEKPLADPAGIPALLGPDGRFLETGTARRRALLRRLPQDQIEREVEAQIAFVRDHGVPVSHVDSHRHMHKLAPYREALRRVLPRFGVTRVRNVQNVWLRRPLTSATFWLGPLWRRALMRHVTTTDYFYMPTGTDDDDAWPGRLLAEIAPLRGSLEVGVHPGRGGEAPSVVALAEAARGRHRLISWNEVA